MSTGGKTRIRVCLVLVVSVCFRLVLSSVFFYFVLFIYVYIYLVLLYISAIFLCDVPGIWFAGLCMLRISCQVL